MLIGHEKYVLVTTFRRDGTPVPTAVCVVALDDHEIGFYTASDSGNAKRVAHTPRVVVQPCNAGGKPKPGSISVEGAARIDRGAEHDRIMRLVYAKYPIQTPVWKFIVSASNRIKGESRTFADTSVIVTLDTDDERGRGL
jgi:uncharacterized protein